MKPSFRLLPALLVAAFSAAAAAATVTERFNDSRALAAGGKVSVANLNGDVEIVAWDKAEVSIVAEKSAQDETGLKRMEIVIEAAADHVSIKTKHARGDSFWFGHNQQTGAVRYKIHVPAELAQLRVEVMNSNVTTENVRGDVKISSMNGRIRASGLTGNTSIDTLNGRIYAAFDKVGAGQKLSFDTMNGSCEITLPAEASAHVVAGTMNGQVSSEIPIAVERSSRHSLRGSIGKGEASLSLDSMNGSLTLRARS